jgi:hypothetical protein
LKYFRMPLRLRNNRAGKRCLITADGFPVRYVRF